ncbi:unnamed protein product [Moneuplotes crassus]|uniref:Uncharacterized protein n=1 Tax=Euplotes crassus TaxID=5936 RepID=A0AAD1XFR9_EUPCR|nr:unnamed protein product [Moneuplotes crassus]
MSQIQQSLEEFSSNIHQEGVQKKSKTGIKRTNKAYDIISVYQTNSPPIRHEKQVAYRTVKEMNKFPRSKSIGNKSCSVKGRSYITTQNERRCKNKSMFEIMMNKKASEMNIKVLSNRILYLSTTDKKANRKLALAKKRANEMAKIKRSKFEYSQHIQDNKRRMKSQLEQRKREISATRKRLRDNIILKRAESVNLKRKMRLQTKSFASQALEKRKMINLCEQKQKEIAKINIMAEKFKCQNKRERGMQRKITQLKQLYSEKKIDGLKHAEENAHKAEKLEHEEQDLMQKLHTTYQKVNEFMEQSNSFDNFANIVKSNVQYNTKYLKPLARVDKVKGRSSTNRSCKNIKIQIQREA